MNQREVEDLIIDLLAQDAGRTPADLREELAERGESLPIDSLLAAEVIARIEERLGIRYPATAESARNLGSVEAFAQAILDLIADNQSRGATA
ncbi:MAG TPA: acyl carrier protein [Anaerolineae bacterium]|nr:acyl carrier protein [Anaerolineae bacterium]